MPHDSISNYYLIYIFALRCHQMRVHAHIHFIRNRNRKQILCKAHIQWSLFDCIQAGCVHKWNSISIISWSMIGASRGCVVFKYLLLYLRQFKRRKKLLSNTKHKQKNEIHIYLDSIKRCIAILKVNNKYCDSPELVFYVCFHSLGRLRLQPARATHTVANIAIASSINVPTIDNKNHAFVATIWSLKNCKLCITNYDQIADGNMCNKIQHKNEFKCVRVLFTERTKNGK